MPHLVEIQNKIQNTKNQHTNSLNNQTQKPKLTNQNHTPTKTPINKPNIQTATTPKNTQLNRTHKPTADQTKGHQLSISQHPTIPTNHNHNKKQPITQSYITKPPNSNQEQIKITDH